MTGPMSAHRVAIARRNFGDAIVATIALQIPAIVAWVSANRAGQVFWEIVLVVGPALAIGRTAFLYGKALGWSQPRCWLAACTGLVGIAAWIMYFVLAPSAAKPVTSDAEEGAPGRTPPAGAPPAQRDDG